MVGDLAGFRLREGRGHPRRRRKKAGGMKLSVVIAAYDERENVAPLARRLHAALSSLSGWTWEIIWVVEGNDGTKEALEGLSDEVPGMKVLWSAQPSGLGAAFRRGFAAVAPDADHVVTMDADLNHQPEELPRLLEAAVSRHLDILVGSRFVRGGEVRGIPLWKRALSGSINMAMRLLYGVTVRDKTSGYRVYRASSLGRLPFRNDRFAFLPEILVSAHRLGMKVEEEPILFIYRVHGESKMRIVETSRSYLSLFRSRFDRFSLAVAFLFLAGLAVRLVATFPLYKWGADADSLGPPLVAFRILEGHLKTFYNAPRLGAAESYLHALAFAVFGVSREATAFAPLVVSVVFTLVTWLLYRRLLDRKAALSALLLVAIPSPSLLFWTYQPNGWGLTMLFASATLLGAAIVVQEGGSPARGLFLGLAAGLGWWNCMIAAAPIAGAAAWILLRRRDALRQVGFLTAIGAGFLTGALPWFVYNVQHGMPSLRHQYVQPSGGISQSASNLGYVLSYDLPELLVEADPTDGGSPPPPASRLLAPAAAGIFLAAAAFGLFRFRESLPELFPLWITAGAIAAMSTFSEAGAIRGLTARYALPAYLLGPALVARLGEAAGRRRSALAFVPAGIVAAFFLVSVPLPGSPLRVSLKRDAAIEGRVVDRLRSDGIESVWGSYVFVYPFNFLTRETVRGVPYEEFADLYRYRDALPQRPIRWALFSRIPGELAAWVGRIGVGGRIFEFGNGHDLFLPDPNPPDGLTAPQVQQRVLQAVPAPGTYP
jgi:dolichol-phosphate mannosyltransferase